jgi:serine/threonine protein kinase
MLDGMFRGKVGDFGLSRVVDCQDRHPPGAAISNFAPGTIKTTAAGFTPGYAAPEVGIGSPTEKTNVYSFGVVCLETTCGRPAVIDCSLLTEANITEWVWKTFLVEEDGLEIVLDKRLRYKEEQSDPAWVDPIVLLKIGLLCTYLNLEDRPSMEGVLQMLAEKTTPQVQPLPRHPECVVSSILLSTSVSETSTAPPDMV